MLMNETIELLRRRRSLPPQGWPARDRAGKKSTLC